MKHLKTFILSERKKYQELQLARQDIQPNVAPGSPEQGLNGWSYMMRTSAKDLAFLYFENKSVLPVLNNFKTNCTYYMEWFNPLNGEWGKKVTINSDGQGKIKLPDFPDGQNPSSTDWAAKIIIKQ
jgi:hypothetical protein